MTEPKKIYEPNVESKVGEIDYQTLNNLTAQNQLQFQELLMKLMQQNSQIAQNVNFNMLINPHVNSINQMPSPSSFQDVFNEMNKNITPLQPVKKNTIIQEKMYSSQQQAPLTQIFNSNNSPDSNEIFGIKKANNLKVDKQTLKANQDLTEDTMGNSLGDNFLDDKVQENKKKIKERTVKIKPFNPDSETNVTKEKVRKVSKTKEKKKKKTKEKKSQSKEVKEVKVSIEKKKKSKSKDLVEKKAVTDIQNKSIHQFLKISHKKIVRPQKDEVSTLTNETCDLIVQNKLSPAKDSNLDLSTESKTPELISEQKKHVQQDQKKQMLDKEQDELAAEALDFYQKEKEKEDLISLSSMGKEQMNELTRKQLQELNSKVQKQFNQLNQKAKKESKQKAADKNVSVEKKVKSSSIEKKGKSSSIEQKGQMQIQQFKVMDKQPCINPVKAPIKITKDFSKFENAIYQPISLKANNLDQGAENSSDVLKLTAEAVLGKRVTRSKVVEDYQLVDYNEQTDVALSTNTSDCGMFLKEVQKRDLMEAQQEEAQDDGKSNQSKYSNGSSVQFVQEKKGKKEIDEDYVPISNKKKPNHQGILSFENSKQQVNKSKMVLNLSKAPVINKPKETNELKEAGNDNNYRRKEPKLNQKQIRDSNQEKFETVYKDGVEKQIKNQGYHPSGRQFYRLDQETIDSCLAWWTKPDVIMDYNQRRPDHPDFDKTTIHIPTKAWEQLTSSMIQYWRLKQFHFDKIFFFRLGKFYEVFYDDAVLCNEILSLHWMSQNKKLHTGFPEKKLNKYIGLLVSKGHKVAIVESTETSREALQRNITQKASLTSETLQNMSIEDKLDQKQGLVTNRIIHNIFTKGTFNDLSKDSYEPQFVMALSRCAMDSEESNTMGICYFDMSTFKCFLGSFQDNEGNQTLRNCIAKIRPVEIIYDQNQMTKEIEKMLKNLPIQPVINIIPPEKMKSIQRCQNVIDKYLYSAEDEQNREVNPNHKVLFDMRWEAKYLTAILAFGNAATFLEINMLLNQSLKFFEYHEFKAEIDLKHTPFMILDSQAIENLEVAQCVVNGSSTVEGSLLQWVDHTQTLFGKRQIRKWLLSPLIDPIKINERLDSVEDLMRIPEQVKILRSKLSTLIDLEKVLARVFIYSVKNTFKAVSFENIQFQKLKEFKHLLSQFKQVHGIVRPLRDNINIFRSIRLKQLITYTTEHETGLLPYMNDAIKELDYLVIWRRCTGIQGVPGGEDDLPEPRRGIDESFDKANDKVLSIKDNLKQYLQTIRQQFRQLNPSRKEDVILQIRFVHARYRYEIEVPNSICDNKPDECIITSQRATYTRFHTDTIKELMEQLEAKEELLRDAITPFICAIFQRFYENRSLWKPVVSVLQELDCLQSLSIASSQNGEKCCRPILIPDIDHEGQILKRPFLDLTNMQHPGVKMKNQKDKKSNKIFVPNSTVLSTTTEPSRALLVTGPNMGGKSTLLRQTCLAVILAQMGCFVPAEKMIFTPVDRIFTRLGASDRILEGKSTFFVEMEETKTILAQGTKRSLAIIDELGRGTSTFDGYSIANAVLSYLVRQIKCRSLFATHYHMLLDDYRNCPGVSSYHMSCKEDAKTPDQIKFLYKFVKGECPQSFGMNVAMMSGLSKKIVDHAKIKSIQFNEMMAKLSKNCVANKFYKEVYAEQTWSQTSSQQSIFNEKNHMKEYYDFMQFGKNAPMILELDSMQLKELASQTSVLEIHPTKKAFKLNEQGFIESREASQLSQQPQNMDLCAEVECTLENHGDDNDNDLDREEIILSQTFSQFCDQNKNKNGIKTTKDVCAQVGPNLQLGTGETEDSSLDKEPSQDDSQFIIQRGSFSQNQFVRKIFEKND